MAPTIQTAGAGTPSSEKRTPTTHSTPVPPRTTERRSELVCRVKYNNTLPDIPFDCKFIAYPFESTRFIDYKSTSLERNYKYEVLTEHDLGVTIDLINKDTYAPNYNVQLDPADEKLLEEDIITPQDSKRSRHHARSVSWLRRTEYISTEQTRFQPQVMDKVEAKVGFSIKKNFKDDTLYMDRDSQVKAIEKTFADTKLPIEKHYSKPNVTPVEVMPVYPDFKYWKYPCAQVIFDSDPAPQGRPIPAQIEEMSQAMIRGVMDESGEQFVAYFLPTTETLDKRKLDVLNNVEYMDEQEYDYKMAREYNWNVKSKSCKGYEENYFLIVRDDAVYYNELETRVRLSKRRQKVGAAPNNTRLVVTHRPLNATEFRIQRLRERFLEPPNEEEEEEEEDEEEEETEEVAADTQEGDTTAARTSDTEDKRSSRASSRSRSKSPAKRSRSGSASSQGSNKSAASNKSGAGNRSRSGSRARSTSGSPARSKSGSPARSKSGSPTKSKSGSPARSKSGSPARSKSGSPARSARSSRSGSPAGSEKSRRSKSPASSRSAYSSRSPTPDNSPAASQKSGGSGRAKSVARSTSRSGSEASGRSSRSPSQARSNRSTSQARSNRSPSQARSCRSPSQARSSRSPSQARSSRSASQARSSRSPSRARSSRSPSHARSSRSPSQARSSRGTSPAGSERSRSQSRARSESRPPTDRSRSVSQAPSDRSNQSKRAASQSGSEKSRSSGSGSSSSDSGSDSD